MGISYSEMRFFTFMLSLNLEDLDTIIINLLHIRIYYLERSFPGFFFFFFLLRILTLQYEVSGTVVPANNWFGIYRE